MSLVFHFLNSKNLLNTYRNSNNFKNPFLIKNFFPPLNRKKFILSLIFPLVGFVSLTWNSKTNFPILISTNFSLESNCLKNVSKDTFSNTQQLTNSVDKTIHFYFKKNFQSSYVRKGFVSSAAQAFSSNPIKFHSNKTFFLKGSLAPLNNYLIENLNDFYLTCLQKKIVCNIKVHNILNQSNNLFWFNNQTFIQLFNLNFFEKKSPSLDLKCPKKILPTYFINLLTINLDNKIVKSNLKVLNQPENFYSKKRVHWVSLSPKGKRPEGDSDSSQVFRESPVYFYYKAKLLLESSYKLTKKMSTSSSKLEKLKNQENFFFYLINSPKKKSKILYNFHKFYLSSSGSTRPLTKNTSISEFNLKQLTIPFEINQKPFPPEGENSLNLKRNAKKISYWFLLNNSKIKNFLQENSKVDFFLPSNSSSTFSKGFTRSYRKEKKLLFYLIKVKHFSKKLSYLKEFQKILKLNYKLSLINQISFEKKISCGTLVPKNYNINRRNKKPLFKSKLTNKQEKSFFFSISKNISELDLREPNLLDSTKKVASFIKSGLFFKKNLIPNLGLRNPGMPNLQPEVGRHPLRDQSQKTQVENLGPSILTDNFATNQKISNILPLREIAYATKEEIQLIHANFNSSIETFFQKQQFLFFLQKLLNEFLNSWTFLKISPLTILCIDSGNNLKESKFVFQNKFLNKKFSSIENLDSSRILRKGESVLKKEKIFRTLLSSKSNLETLKNSSPFDVRNPENFGRTKAQFSFNRVEQFFLENQLVSRELLVKTLKRLKMKAQSKKYKIYKKEGLFHRNVKRTIFKKKSLNNIAYATQHAFAKRKKKLFSLNETIQKIGFVFYPSISLTNFSTDRLFLKDSLGKDYFKNQKYLQKKRRRKKLKLENRRRKKRKRFYPRPLFNRYNLYRQFLNSRYNKSLLENSRSPLQGETQRRGAKKKANFLVKFNNLSSKLVFPEGASVKPLKKKFDFYQKNKKLSMKLSLYRNNKQKWGNFLLDTTLLEKNSLRKFVLATQLPIYLNKNNYKIGRVRDQILNDFMPLYWKSYWLRTNLTPYMNRIRQNFNYQKSIAAEQLQEPLSSKNIFLSSLLGNSIHTSFKSNQQTVISFYSPKNSSFLLNEFLGFNPEINSRLLENIRLIREHDRILFHRISEILKNVKYNMNLDGENSIKSYKLPKALPKVLNNSSLKDQTNSLLNTLKSSMFQQLDPNLSLFSAFNGVHTWTGKKSTILKPYGSNATLRVLWAFNKTNLFSFKEKNSIRNLWETYKNREQCKSNQTKKFLKKTLTKLVNNFVNLETGKLNKLTFDKWSIIDKKLYSSSNVPSFFFNNRYQTPSISRNKLSRRFAEGSTRAGKANKKSFYENKFRKFFTTKLVSEDSLFIKFYSLKEKNKFLKNSSFIDTKISARKSFSRNQKPRLKKSSVFFWWSNKSLKTPFSFQIENSFQPRKGNSNVVGQVENSIWSFSILFHLCIFINFLKIPELRNLFKFQVSLTYKVLNIYFITLFYFYNSVKKFQTQIKTSLKFRFFRKTQSQFYSLKQNFYQNLKSKNNKFIPSSSRIDFFSFKNSKIYSFVFPIRGRTNSATNLSAYGLSPLRKEIGKKIRISFVKSNPVFKFQTLSFLSVTKISKFFVLLGLNSVQLSYKFLLKIISFIESLLLLIYKFLEKPAELMIESIAQIFLIEWISDIATFIPETLDKNLWESFQKLSRPTRILGVFFVYQQSNTLLPFYKTTFQPFLTSIPFSFLGINTLKLYYMEIWHSIFKPDMDISSRQKRGVYFMNIWAEIFIQAAEKYQMNVASLVSNSIEQEKFMERLLKDPDIFSRKTLNSQGSPILQESKLLQKHLRTKAPAQNFLTRKNFLTDNSFTVNQHIITSCFGGQATESDLFLDISPPKSFLPLRSSPVSFILGPVICEVYSGLFSKKVSKNILLVTKKAFLSNSRPTNGNVLIQALAGETEMKLIIDNAKRYAMNFHNKAIGMRLLKDVFMSIALQTPSFFLMEDIHFIGEKRPMLIGNFGVASATDTVGKDILNLEQDEVHFQNQQIYQLSRHKTLTYKRFSEIQTPSVPSNLYSKHFYSKKVYKTFGSNLSKDFFDAEFFNIFNKSVAKQKKHPLPLTFIEKILQPNSSIEKENKNLLVSRLQKQTEEFFAPPSTSPFTILLMKDQKKLKVRKTQFIPWTIFKNSNKKSSIIRAKIAELADITLRNFSVSLDMITDLLVIVDSVRSNRGFVVFATTPVPSVLDPALRRPGRFDETLCLPEFSNYENSLGSSRGRNLENFFYKFDFIVNRTSKLDLVSSLSPFQILLNSHPKGSRKRVGAKINQTSSVFSSKDKGFYLKPSVPYGTLGFPASLTKIFFLTSSLISDFLIQTDLLKNQTNKYFNETFQYHKNSDNLTMLSIHFSSFLSQDFIVAFLGPKVVQFFYSSFVPPSQYVAGFWPFGDTSERIFYNLTDSNNSKDFIFSLIEKRYLFQKNFIVSKLLKNNFSNSLKEPPGPPISEILMPAKKYEAFKATEKDFIFKNSFSIYEKMHTHQANRFLKKLYNQPIQLYFKSHTFDYTTFVNSFKELGSIHSKSSGSQLLLNSSTNYYYKTRFLMRHCFSITNQWSNAQLPEHNTESTFLSDVDWRSMYLQSLNQENKGADKKFFQKDYKIDFSDADQHYNPRIRKWIVSKHNSSEFLLTEKNYLIEIYSHFLMQSFYKTYKYFDKNRELLDYFIFNYLLKGSLLELNSVFMLTRFYKK